MQKKLTICSKKKKKNFLCSQFYAKNVAIYAFFWGKIEKVGKLTDVKNLTNFMSDYSLIHVVNILSVSKRMSVQHTQT